MRRRWRTLVMGGALFTLAACSAPTTPVQPSVTTESAPTTTPASLVARLVVSVEERFHSGQQGTLAITQTGATLTRLAVDWGDGSVSDVEPTGSEVAQRLSHVYASPGAYLLAIRLEEATGASTRVGSTLFVD